MEFIPIMLNVSSRDLVVIGGGTAALKKIENMKPKFQKVTVISEEFDSEFESADIRKVKMRLTDPEQLSGFVNKDSIVVIATDDRNMNREIRDYCSRKGLLFNSVDEADSPFIFPATFSYGGVTLSVSTDGRSPSLARFIRDRLKEQTVRYSLCLPVIQRLRKDVNFGSSKEKARFFSLLLNDEIFWKLVSDRKDEKAYKYGMDKSTSKLVK